MKSTDASLSSIEMETIRRSLRATVDGSFFPDWEFETLIGFSRDEIRAVYDAWPPQTFDRDGFGCAVIASLNSLIGYPHGKDAELIAYIPEGREAIRTALDHLTALMA